MEPVQDLVRVLLEQEGYFVRSNVRFHVEGDTPTGRTASYSDLDVIAVKVDPATNKISSKRWGEVKSHLTCSLTPSYLHRFAKGYVSFLDLNRLVLSDRDRRNYESRQNAARSEATRLLGADHERVIYFGGIKPLDGGAGVRHLLPGVEIVFVRDWLRKMLPILTHREGSEPVIRVITMLRSYGYLLEPTDQFS